MLSGKGQRLIVVHAGSAEIWIDGGALVFRQGQRKMILSMGAGQLDLRSRVSHSLIITLLP